MIRLLLVAATLLSITTAPRPAAADPPTGSLVYASGRALWRLGPDGKGPPAELAPLDADATSVRSLRASPDGRLLVLDLDGVAAWLAPGAAALARGPCTGPGVPDPLGTCLACPAGDTTVLVRLAAPDRPLRLGVPVDQLQFRGPTVKEVVFAAADGLLAALITRPDQRRRLAPHRPTDHLLIAPDGARAVGRYADGAGAAVLAFRLDGKAVQRKLAGDGRPLAWSADSQWVLVQEGETACVLRAVGGERKCWTGYAGQALSPDGGHVLLARPASGTRELFVAAIPGTRPAAPHRVAGGVDGPALWLP